MQRFVAELSTAIEEGAFGKSWRSNQFLNDEQLNVKFIFTGRRVSAEVDSSPRWLSTDFYKTFSAAVRRLDQSCNVRWI